MDDSRRRASAEGQLNLLLEEYRSLRAEVNQRIGASASLVGFVAAGAAFVVSSDGGHVAWIAASIVGLLATAVWVSYLLSIRSLGGYLRRLEGHINSCARVAYDVDGEAALMVWESRLAVNGGWIRRVFRRAGGSL